jgi:hypothetical protein
MQLKISRDQAPSTLQTRHTRAPVMHEAQCNAVCEAHHEFWLPASMRSFTTEIEGTVIAFLPYMLVTFLEDSMNKFISIFGACPWSTLLTLQQ